MIASAKRQDPSQKAEKKQRRALSHVGGQSEGRGDPRLCEVLALALDVPTSEESEAEARAHMHGFHAYPARMHPTSARRLIEAFSKPGDRVLDPFCGSGTVLLEARLLGRLAVGVDANPLATRIAWLKASGMESGAGERLILAAQQVAAGADERRLKKAGPTHRYGAADRELFDVHVLLELDSLRFYIDQVPDEELRFALELVLSAILIKVSRRASDTVSQSPPKRIAAGFTAKLFVRKTEELVARRKEIHGRLVNAPKLRVLEGDARVLSGVDNGSIALCITSPPYPGVYDYLEHHEARLRWLRLRADRFEEREIGARRKLDAARHPEAAWESDMADVLSALQRVLVPSGNALLLVADSVVGGRALYTLDVLEQASRRLGFTLKAAASQERPHFHKATAQAFERAGRPRREHAILLSRDRK